MIVESALEHPALKTALEHPAMIVERALSWRLFLHGNTPGEFSWISKTSPGRPWVSRALGWVALHRLREMGGAPRNPAPRNRFCVWIVKPSGCHCTDGPLTSSVFTDVVGLLVERVAPLVGADLRTGAPGGVDLGMNSPPLIPPPLRHEFPLINPTFSQGRVNPHYINLDVRTNSPPLTNTAGRAGY